MESEIAAPQHDLADVTEERVPLTKSELAPADDWRGLADAKERRRRQNRLNQRRHRTLLSRHDIIDTLMLIRIQAKRPEEEGMQMNRQTVFISCLHPSQLDNYIK